MPDALSSHEPAHLHHASAEHELELPADALAAAAATVILCGAADEEAALAALSRIPELEDVITPPFLLRMLTDTTEEQDRRALRLLARAATTHPRLRTCLIELLTVLPGLSPAAVDAALTGGSPAPLAAALVSLGRNAALPAELLDDIPAGITVLGEFPVLLAESLVEAYTARVARYPDSAPRGLVRSLIELAERLADLGRADQAVAAAQRAVQVAGGLADKLDFPVRAAASLRRAEELARQEH